MEVGKAGADAAARALEPRAVLHDRDAEVDLARVFLRGGRQAQEVGARARGAHQDGARDGELARAQRREQVEEVVARDARGAELLEDLADGPPRPVAVLVEVVLGRG